MNKNYDYIKCDSDFCDDNSVDVQVNDCDCEIRADIISSERKSVRIWGQVKNCNGQPIEGALLKLLKVQRDHCRCEYQGIAHTISDCKGFYQFELCPEETGCEYKILVGLPVSGCERVIERDKCYKHHEHNCRPDDDCRPCECRPMKCCKC